MNPLLALPHLDRPSNGDVGWPIGAVERETGLGKDTLRAWERRYGFPTPIRDSSGDRLYSAAQVQRLKLICRLLDGGMRPSKVVAMDSGQLETLLAEHAAQPSVVLSRTTGGDPNVDPPLEHLLDVIGTHNPQALRHQLTQAQLRMGLAPFVTDLVAPLTTAVGDAWAQGRFEIFEEHLYTEVITGVMRHAIGSLMSQSTPQGPKVLLTTVPQEQHGLGLLMVEALLVLEGGTCISLGTQTPVSDIAQAALAHRADVVALSFSNFCKSAMVQGSLRELRAQLPAATALWAGGSCNALYQRPLTGVSTVLQLSSLQPLVTQWRHVH